MESNLPWTRWNVYEGDHPAICNSGHPVGLKTRLGVLLTGDDGNIYIACARKKAYAIKVFIKPDCMEKVIFSTLKKYATDDSRLYEGWNTFGFGSPAKDHMTQLFHELAKTGHGQASSILIKQMYSDSKRDGSLTTDAPFDRDASRDYLRTNIGLERFDDLDLDLNAWDATSIQLEPILPIFKTNYEYLDGSFLEYRAKEVKLRNRSTDRVTSEQSRTYDSRMAKAFQANMSVDPIPAWYSTTWTASPSVVFLPSVAEIDWENDSQTNRRRKSKLTSQHALENVGMNRSECSWEFDAWKDIFSGIRDDPLLAMDKHQVVFLESKSLDRGSRIKSKEAPLGEHTVRTIRIPDCTFGLSVTTAVVGLGEEDGLPLSRTSLEDLFWHEKSGLISDPKWLSFQLAFPWAVYEAKKTTADPVVAQVRRSSEIYLNILHDLCLQPGPPELARPYQNDEKGQFQVFSMISEGPHWRLYVCYRRLIREEPLWLQDPADIQEYDMKQIWQGNITKEEEAWQLHCLVDQIHEWAVKTFRPFVLERLKTWHAYLTEIDNPNYETTAQGIQGSFKNLSLQPPRERLRITMEPFLESQTQEVLEILDDEVSQQEDQLGLPWWSKYRKPNKTRKRLLNADQILPDAGQFHPSAEYKEPNRTKRKRPNQENKNSKREKEADKLNDAFNAQEAIQDQEKLDNPNKQREEKRREKRERAKQRKTKENSTSENSRDCPIVLS